MLSAAMPLLAASLTSDPFSVGVVSSAAYAAWLIVGLPVGALVDRSPLRRVMIAADGIRAAALLALVTLMTVGHASIWALSAVALVLGVGSCFFDPAAQVMIPTLAGRDAAELRRLNGRFWALDTLGRSLVGPPLGAGLFAWAQQLPFLADSLSFAVSATLLARLPRRTRTRTPTPSLWAAIRDGLNTVWRRRRLRSAALGMGVYNFGWSVANATLVLFATLTLQLSAPAFGGVLAAAALGGIVGGWAHHIIGDTEIRRVYALALLLQSGAWWLVAATRQATVLVGAVIVVGFANTAISTAGAVTRQRHTPDALLGRVAATTRVVGVGAAAMGSLVGGALANSHGLASPFTASAAVLLAAGVCFAIGSPQ